MKFSLVKRIDKFDKRFVCRINQKNFHSIIEFFFKVSSHIGSFVFWTSFAFIAYVLDLFDLSFWLYATCINGGIIALSLKLIFRRDRPFIDKEIGKFIVLKDKFVISKHTSFPSGHSVYFSACSIILLYVYNYWWLYLLIIPIGFIVAYTRVILGAHYPSDVIFGFLIGAIASIITIIVFPYYLPLFCKISNKLREWWWSLFY